MVKHINKKNGRALLFLSLGAAIVLLAAACKETPYKPSPSNNAALDSSSNSDDGRNLLTPDEYNSKEARKQGYTIIHEDTSTASDDQRCEIGGARYSRNGQSMCDIFQDSGDWYSGNQAASTNCPNGFQRVDQANIGRQSLAGSTRQCRTTNQISTVNERAHYYCPHGSNLVGTRSGASANRYGVCRLKCDPDTRHFYQSQCGGSTPTPRRTTTTTSPRIPNIPRVPSIPRVPNIPNVPNIPRVPSIPDTPNVPGIPDTPNVPGIPNTPNVPTGPTPGNPPANTSPQIPSLFGFGLNSAPSPRGVHIVGVSTWFWISPALWIPKIKTTQIPSVPPRTYVTTALPSRLRIQISGPDSETISCGATPGIPWVKGLSRSPCSFEWTNAGTYTARAKVEWTIRWVCVPACGAGTYKNQQTIGAPITLRISESQALIVPTPQ